MPPFVIIEIETRELCVQRPRAAFPKN